MKAPAIAKVGLNPFGEKILSPIPTDNKHVPNTIKAIVKFSNFSYFEFVLSNDFKNFINHLLSFPFISLITTLCVTSSSLYFFYFFKNVLSFFILFLISPFNKIPTCFK